MSGSDGKDSLVVSLEKYGFDLNLTPNSPPILHSEDGVVDLQGAGDSYYYSRTRQLISGVMHFNGNDSLVSGIGWFGHQWGNLDPTEIRWDWFSLHFDDETDLMVTVLRNRNREIISQDGTLVKSGEAPLYFGDHEVQGESSGCWVSPDSGIRYPTSWRLEIPKHGIKVILCAQIPGSEFNAMATTGNFYWKGTVEVVGTHTGKGFVELTGYPLPKEGYSDALIRPC